MNSKMLQFLKGQPQTWESINPANIVKVEDKLINGVKVQTIPDPSYIPESLMRCRTVDSGIHFEFRYPEPTFEYIVVENRFGRFKLDKYYKNIVEITFYNKLTASQWTTRKTEAQSHSGIITAIVREKLDSL